MFKLFLVLISVGNPATIDIRPAIELQTLDACKELKAFYEATVPATRIRAKCIDDGAASEDEDTDDKAK